MDYDHGSGLQHQLAQNLVTMGQFNFKLLISTALYTNSHFISEKVGFPQEFQNFFGDITLANNLPLPL
jgi:hypothetical protein